MGIVPDVAPKPHAARFVSKAAFSLPASDERQMRRRLSPAKLVSRQKRQNRAVRQSSFYYPTNFDVAKPTEVDLRRSICLALPLLVISSAVGAADVATVPAAEAAAIDVSTSAPLSWTGPYLGTFFGDRWSRTSWTTTATFNGVPPLPPVTPPFTNADTAAFTAGTYFGYNYQVAPWLVAGVEGDVAGGNIRRHISAIPGTFPGSLTLDSVSVGEGWDASIRGRLGVLLAPSLLIYGTGGWSWQEFIVSATCIADFRSWCAQDRGETASFVKSGWTAGGGIEARLGGNWLGRVEYRYSDYGRTGHDFFVPTVPLDPFDKHDQITMYAPLRTQSLTFGIAYQFANETAPQQPAPIYTKAPPAPAAPPPWVTTFASDVRYYSWQGNRGYPTNAPTATGSGSGSEVYTPFALQLVGRPSDDVKIELLARGGSVWARQSTAGLTGEVSTATDTVVSGTATYLGVNGIQPFLSISSNLPTGRSNLPGSAAFARMDPDLVGIGSFGEGFNIGPTVGFNLPVTPSFILTSSAGYSFRGGYNRENSLTAISPIVQSPVRVEPGDVLTLVQAAAWEWGQLKTVLTGTVSEETDTVENGTAVFRSGRRYVVSGSWTYNWPDAGTTKLTAAAAHSNRNAVLAAGLPPPVTEVLNTNSDVYRVGLQHLFPVQNLSIGPVGSFLFRDHNGYDADTLQFVPEKRRWTGGLLARYAASETLTFNMRAEYVGTRENDNPAPAGSKFSFLSGGSVLAVAVPVVSSTAIS